MLTHDRLLDHRTILNAGPTSGAEVHFNASGAFSNLDFEISGFAIDGFEIRVGDKLDVQMPADLDQYRRDNSHRAVVGWEGLVKLRHHPADGG